MILIVFLSAFSFLINVVDFNKFDIVDVSARQINGINSTNKINNGLIDLCKLITRAKGPIYNGFISLIGLIGSH